MLLLDSVETYPVVVTYMEAKRRKEVQMELRDKNLYLQSIIEGIIRANAIVVDKTIRKALSDHNKVKSRFRVICGQCNRKIWSNTAKVLCGQYFCETPKDLKECEKTYPPPIFDGVKYRICKSCGRRGPMATMENAGKAPFRGYLWVCKRECLQR